MAAERAPGSGAPAVGEPAADVHVRPARPGDVRGFLELYRTVAAEGRFLRANEVTRSPRSFRRQFRRSATAEDVSLVAVWGDLVIGELAASREDHPTTRHIASVGMMVAPAWRGRGVGTALLAEGLRWARGAGVEKLALAVYPDNAPALALYRRFGFEVEGRLTGHSKKASGYRDEIVMGLWLAERPSEGSG